MERVSFETILYSERANRNMGVEKVRGVRQDFEEQKYF